eukprot:Hpha_TRINITY_DN16673_c2_g8::TRINITY_DN16673_c2_g8_i1::g.180797::m.180797
MDVLTAGAYWDRYSGGKVPRGYQFVKYEPQVDIVADTRVHFMYDNARQVQEQAFGCWLHPSFTNAAERLTLTQKDIDKASKDKGNKRFARNFVIELTFNQSGKSDVALAS